MNVYLDHNSTTPIASEVLDAMEPWLTTGYGNASSPYTLGRESKKALEAAREKLAGILGAGSPESICFTGSGSESDNMAIKGVARALRGRGNHIITSMIEHPAVLNACRALEDEGFRVSYMKPDRSGMVRPDAVAAEIGHDTILISIMHANNETGTINPVREIADAAKHRSIPVHTDAVQSFCKIPVTVDDLGVDLLSISGHKLQGPKGVGALYVREGVPLKPLIHGGHQEGDRRAGTENLAGIVGLVTAAELEHAGMDFRRKRIRSLRDRLERGLTAKIPDVRLNGHREQRLPNTLNLSFPFVESESLLLELDLRGVAVSSGSACTSGTGEPSHVLLAMGIPHEICRGALRFSLGRENTEAEIDYVADIMPGIVKRIQAMSPLAG